MAKINQATVDTALTILETAPENLLANRVERIAALAEKTRPRIEDALTSAGDAGGSAAAPESAEAAALARYQQEYDHLPAGAKGRLTWDAVSVKLLANEGAKLKKADAMQGGGHLFHITKKGEVLFKDKGVEPVMYGWDKPEGEEDRHLVQIYGRNAELMAKIKQWANALEIEGRVTADGYELFEDNGKYRFSEAMQRAANANDDKLFVASENRQERRYTVLKNSRRAYFHPHYRRVYVDGASPATRNVNRGAVRLLRV